MQQRQSRPARSTARRFTFMIISAIALSLMILSSCSSEVNNTVNPSSNVLKADNQPPSNTPAGAFNSLHMMTATTGWAENMIFPGNDTAIYYTILRTTDGGAHWKVMLKCSPFQGGGKGAGFATCLSDFHSATVATILQPEYNSATKAYRSHIFHTNDGGQTWQSALIDAGHLETLPTFSDAMHGWVLATDQYPGLDPGSAYIGKEIALFHTSDGGKTWQRIASGPATSQLSSTSDDAYGKLPLTASARITFPASSTGWLAGTSYHKDLSSFSWLYATHDAGKSWQQSPLSFPAQSLITSPPTFFSAQDGILLVLTSGPAPQYARGTLLYTTHDGGNTWTSTNVPFDITNAQFLDANHAWAPPVSINDRTFYTTSDGWQHWTKGTMQVSYKRVYDFDFVTPATGWALANNIVVSLPEPGGGLRKGDTITLLKTTDGGQTWQEVAHSKL